MIKQFIKFALIGVLNTGIYYTLYLLLLWLGFHYIFAATVGTVAGMINSYVLNKIFTFRSTNKNISEKVKFLIVNAVQYLCSVLTIHICIAYFNISAELAGLVAVPIGMIIGFLGNKFWTFRKDIN